MKKIICLFFLGCTLFAQEKDFTVIQDKCSLTIANPSLSCRKTEKMLLKNGLKVYLISDPNAEKSGAALTVLAGSWQDPKEYPGTAHFLEHMLFQGTKAYPEPNGYFRFIYDHGGLANAFTLSDRTAYLFSIDTLEFSEAFDRFSHFFIDPLFDNTQLAKELHAVDQEFSKNLENDGWRRWQIIKETGNPLHPHAKFSTGNSETLSKIPTEKMKEWFYSHYSADSMYLVVYSSLPLEKLQNLVVEKCSSIQKNQTKEKEQTLPPLFSEQQKGHLLYIDPIQDIQVLSLEWELPKSFVQDDSQSPSLLAYALSYENEGSLLFQLKKEKLIEGAEIGADSLGQSHLLFHIDLNLTEKGLQEVPSILQKCFASLSFFQKNGIPEHLFTERTKMHTWNYEYQMRDDVFSFLQNQITLIPEEDFSTYPEKTFIASHYDPSQIEKMFSFLSPKQGRYSLMANPQKTHVPLTCKEKWLGGEYTLTTLDEKNLQPLENASFKLPEKNSFISTTLTLHTEDKGDVNPKILVNDEKGKLFFFSGQEFTTPEMVLFLRLKSPILNGTALSSVFFDLYAKAMEDKLSSLLSYGDKANLHATYTPKPLSFDMEIEGYSENFSLFLREFLQKFISLSPSKEEFELYVESLKKDYINHEKTLPIKQAKDLISHILFPDNPTVINKKNVLNSFSYIEFLRLQKEFSQKIYIESLLGGNLSIQDGESLYLDLKKIGKETFPLSEHVKAQIFSASRPLCITEKTPLLGQGVILSIHNTTGFSFTNKVAYDVLAQALHEPFFTALRSNQKTAYIVNNGSLEKEKELFHLFFIQSNSHTGEDLLQRMEFFLEDFLLNINTHLPKNRFEDIKKAMIQEWTNPPINLHGKGAKFFSFAFEHGENFSWEKNSIQALEKLSYEEFLDLANEFLSSKNPHRVAVIYSGKLNKPASLLYENSSIEKLQK